MFKEDTPVYFNPGVREGESWAFYSIDKIHEISDFADEIAAVLKLANGRNRSEDILIELVSQGYDEVVITSIIIDLTEAGIIADSRDQINSLHVLTNNPPYFSRDISDKDLADYTANDPFEVKNGRILSDISRIGSIVVALSKDRVSNRNFSNKPLSASELITCFDASYSHTIMPIPSAGGLYPLRMYAIVNNSGDDLARGYYQYDHKTGLLSQFSEDFDEEALKNIFNTDTLLMGASVAVVVAADMKRHSGKYANRGYRYTLLEAGHAAQNLLLTAGELGLASLEYGGFQDEKLATELSMDSQETPIITILLGHAGEDSSPISDRLKILEDLVGHNKPIRRVTTETSPDQLERSFEYTSIAEYVPEGATVADYAIGVASTIQLSRVKAIAEGYERYVSGKFRYDVAASAENLSGEWISPETVRPMTSAQYLRKPYLQKFDTTIPIEWVKGQRADGKNIWVPVDLVYYPLNLDRKLIVETDSSGVAAHFDEKEAVRRALLELIERDAVMRLWMNKNCPKIIDPSCLPLHIKKLNKYWSAQSRITDVLDLSDNGVPVAMVTSRSLVDSWPYFICGAAADNTSFEAALTKAYQEMQGLLNGSLDANPNQVISREEVQSPRQHGDFYHNPTQKDEIAWLWEGDESWQIPQVPTMDIVDKYNPIIIKLSQDISPLHVVRVICPDLVPISFGFGSEHHTHPAVGLKQYNPHAPHFFA